jgi:7,8-dihydropterin-6-yl-methyl-4-(beta-D-ribofuranosyl)aminobenzene 5'-phosphate synthase
MLHISTLIDNLVYPRNLRAEHGLSLYLETDGKKILFDTGMSELFSRNAIAMNIDIAKTDMLVISHGHYDHTGGIAEFLTMNDNAPIYINKEAFQERYHGERYIGIPKSTHIPEDRTIFPENQLTWLSEHLVLLNYPSDLYPDEQYLVYISKGVGHVISGCSHRGIVPIVSKVEEMLRMPVTGITGGLHTQSMEEQQLHDIVKKLNDSHVESLNISHCTGVEAYTFIKNHFKGKTCYNYTGNRINI